MSNELNINGPYRLLAQLVGPAKVTGGKPRAIEDTLFEVASDQAWNGGALNKLQSVRALLTLTPSGKIKTNKPGSPAALVLDSLALIEAQAPGAGARPPKKGETDDRAARTRAQVAFAHRMVALYIAARDQARADALSERRADALKLAEVSAAALVATMAKYGPAPVDPASEAPVDPASEAPVDPAPAPALVD